MSACETREPCRMIPGELRPGDAVIRKPGLVVIGPVWSKPAMYVVRDESGRYDVLHRDELEPREKLATVPDEWFQTYVGDDLPTPAVSIHDAEPAEPPAIQWNPEDSRGDFRSRCGRFVVVTCNGRYTAYDTLGAAIKDSLPLKADAIDWCERRVLAENTRKPGCGG